MDQYIDVLGALRALLDAPGTSPTLAGAKASLPASRISQIFQDGTEVDFDLALSIIPLGSRGSKATYWICPDHIIEVQVLLLQYMCLYPKPNSITKPASRGSPGAIPKRCKSSATMCKYFGGEDSIGLLILDHLKSFAIKQNVSTIDSSEENVETPQVRTAGTARWTCSSDAVIAVGLEQPSEDVTIAKLKRKHLAAFLDRPSPFKTRQDSDLQNQENGNGGEESQASITATRQWLTKHKEVKPIAGICSKRTRFVGLHNNGTEGTWAAMDRNVFINDSLYKHLNDKDWLTEARAGCTEFPHAVLEIRREGNHSSELIQTLDHSHLVRRPLNL